MSTIEFGTLLSDIPPEEIPVTTRLYLALEAIHYYTNPDGTVYVGGGQVVTRKQSIAMAIEQIHYDSSGTGDHRRKKRYRKQKEERS